MHSLAPVKFENQVTISNRKEQKVIWKPLLSDGGCAFSAACAMTRRWQIVSCKPLNRQNVDGRLVKQGFSRCNDLTMQRFWNYAVNIQLSQLSQTGRAGSPLPAANGENQVLCLCLSTGAHGFLPGAASSPEGVRRPTQIVCHVHYPKSFAVCQC
jgi:hypothetical protein